MVNNTALSSSSKLVNYSNSFHANSSVNEECFSVQSSHKKSIVKKLLD